MKILRKMMVALLVIALMVMLLPASVFAAEEKVVIFHTNDIHGRAEGVDIAIRINLYKTMIELEKVALSPHQVLVLDCGDVTHGTNFATLSRGENIIELMNMVGVDAMACGNHEFNYGPAQLKVLESQADFPIMAANITKADASSFFAVNSKIFEVTSDVKIGVFGLATPETRLKAMPSYTVGLDLGAGPNDKDLNVFAILAQAQIDALKAAGADFIVALGHLGVDSESVIRSDHLIGKVQDLDLFVDGHSHTVMETGKLIKDKTGQEVLLVQTGAHFANAGKVTLTFDGKSLKSATAELISDEKLADLAANEAIANKIDDFNDANEIVLGEIIGETAVVLDGEREQVRTGETNLGNLVADSLLNATGADVALCNGGNIRETIPVGKITRGMALDVLPFENTVIVLRVTGQNIIDALTVGAGAYPGTAGGFPHVAGMSYVIVTTGQGDKETFVRVDDVKVAGKPIDPKAYYTLATNDYLADGGDGYTMLKGPEQLTLLGLMMDIFADEVRSLSEDGPFTYGTEGRITVKNVEIEEVVTGETTVYLLAGGFFLATAGLFLALSSRKVDESLVLF